MKKSEMIDFIFHKIFIYNAQLGIEIGEKERDFIALVLDLAEEQGMKPPVIKHCPILLKNEYKWEEEDEDTIHNRR